MSKRIFTTEQVKTLLQNPNVERCSEKSITYCKEFKVEAVKKYYDGLPPREIFEQAQLDTDLIGHKAPKCCLKLWRRIFKDKGPQGLLVENRGRAKGVGVGRPKTRWEDDKEKIKYLEAEVAYLKAENDFLAKLRKKS